MFRYGCIKRSYNVDYIMSIKQSITPINDFSIIMEYNHVASLLNRLGLGSFIKASSFV